MKTKNALGHGTVLACLVLAISPAILSCGSGPSGPPPALAIRSVTDLGNMSELPAIRGRDGGYSGLYQGRSVWIYGDTILGTADEDGSTWHNNSWQWTTDLDARDGVSGFQTALDSAGAPKEFLPQTSEEHTFNEAHRGDPCQETPCGARWALWPGALVEDAERDRALVFYSKIHAEPGDFNFYGVGSSFAVWSKFKDSPERPALRPGTDEPTLMFSQDEPGFGSAALVEGGWLYVFACQTEGLSKPCRLAQVRLDQVTDRASWSYWAGEKRFVANINESTSVFEGNDILSVSYNRHLQVYLAVYSQPMDHQVMVRTAPAPEGPWSDALEAFEAMPPVGDPNGWIYDAQAHPEFEEDSGRIQHVSYSRSTGFLQSEIRLVRLELE